MRGIEKLKKSEWFWRGNMIVFVILLIVTFITFDVLLWGYLELRGVL